MSAVVFETPGLIDVRAFTIIEPRPIAPEVILVPRNAPCPAEVAVEQGDEIPF